MSPDGERESVDGVLFRPVRAGNAFEDTVQRLLQTVRLGVVAPGESLPAERDLASRLGVSRDTVRDAIRALADAGYLVARRGRYGGTFVSEELPTGPVPGSPSALQPVDAVQFGAGDIDDALGLRDILEPGAARAAAARTLSAGERELLWQKLTDTASAGVDDYRRVDSRLHLAIGELAGIPSLLPLLVENRTRVTALLDAIPLLERNIGHSNEQHEQIVQAILRGDPGAAEQAMAEHLSGSAALLRGFLG